ncbi:MAG: RsmE family RNA methyltransferase [Planctomycetia bacterium]
MADRYYAPELSEAATHYALDAIESHHLATVRRRAGTTVELFDGAGLSATAEVETCGRRESLLRILSHRRDPVDDHPPLTLAVAAPKGDRLVHLIEKGTELGVARFILLKTERSVVDPGDAKLDRLRRTAIEACKQCGRNRLPLIDGPTPFVDLLKAVPNGLLLDVQPAVEPRAALSAGADGVTAAIGPEGGWTDAERRAAFDHGWRPYHIPGHVLRIETAALATAAVWRFAARANPCNP